MNSSISLKSDNSLTPLVYERLTDDAGIQHYPSAAQLWLTINGVEQPSGGVPTIGPTNGRVDYVFSASEESTLKARIPGIDYKAKWLFNVGLVEYLRIQYFDVQSVNVFSNVSDADLLFHFAPLTGRKDKVRGDSTSGTTTTLVDTNLLHNYPANIFAGSKLKMMSGANQGQERLINAYDKETATIYVERPFVSTVSNNNAYEIILSYNHHIKEAWKQIQAAIQVWVGRVGFRQQLDGTDLSEAHLQLSLALACETMLRREDDEFDVAKRDKRQQYKAYMDQLYVKLENQLNYIISNNTNGGLVALRPLIYWGK